jgi:hypothetical protein
MLSMSTSIRLSPLLGSRNGGWEWASKQNDGRYRLSFHCRTLLLTFPRSLAINASDQRKRVVRTSFLHDQRSVWFSSWSSNDRSWSCLPFQQQSKCSKSTTAAAASSFDATTDIEDSHWSPPAQQNTTLNPVLDDEHVVTGYLSRILNARVYDAAIETPLQYAKNLSMV